MLSGFFFDGTLVPKALRVVLTQSGLTINKHYMFVFNFKTLLLLRYCCHIKCCLLSVVVVVHFSTVGI